MSTTRSNWRRLACSVVLALFTASVVAGTICSGHSQAHPADARGASSAVAAAVAPERDEPIDASSGQPRRGAHAAVAHSRAADAHALFTAGTADHGAPPAACDPPVYAAPTAAADGGPPLAALQPHAAAGAMPRLASMPASARAQRSPPGPLPRAVFAVSARLRI